MKPARVDTKQKLEVLVQRLDAHHRRARLAEAGEGAPAPTAAPAAGASPQAGQQKAPAGKPAATPESLPQTNPAPSSEVTVEAVVQQLNTLRAGKSLKDTLVQQELARYFEGLDDSEKEALHAYLKGLAQIVSGQVDAGQAEEPSNHGVETKAVGKKTRQIKPNVIQKIAKPAAAPAAAGPKLGAPKEDTTPPSAGPIVPKKR